ncbi:tRNA (adenosine(37)-N6)-threonylcarbamoyltransferase complex dimerization subunit type 1 TsaB [Nonlabens antarcticus]|uniref:tRNA (adenosine(37)-N6)-threonylcarbamoyltransferase complex dimerization subunit type 1 TsaB n=1 Tax=Nonlabens antarcticus TaxID=392714 RepID=UPI0018914A5E|nr:tRNA (adenosine(37)-N6)-threonylcarbamoyltransferase complex dimerization subunit type 1 TsaB [Nonlabens antarcticus]
MGYILCIETTSTNCSVALASEKGGYSNSIGIQHCQDILEDMNDSYSHGELLHIYIQMLLERNNFTTADLDAIAISKGPGSYTGLRIGVASAKGLCYALEIPLISIDTLQSLSLQASQEGIVIPMVDARRMEVYSAVYRKGEEIESVKAIVLNANSMQEYLDDGNSIIIGSGAAKFQGLLKDQNNTYINTLSSALTMCDLAMEAYKKSDIVEDIAYYEPFYLKEFKAG